jgi:hypothetical protein
MPAGKNNVQKSAPKKVVQSVASVPTVSEVAAPAVSAPVSNVVATPVAEQSVNNVEAIISLILSIVSLCAAFLPCVGMLFPIAGLILGFLGINKAKKLNGNGQTMAIIGTVLSGLILLFIICASIFYAIAAIMESGGTGYYY